MPRPLARFFLSCLLAFAGGHMVNYAVILYLQEKVGSDLLSGLGFGLSFGSSLVFGWFAGVLCDRMSPLRVIHAAQWIFLLAFAGLWATDAVASASSRTGFTLGAALLAGLAWSYMGPARLAALGQLAPASRLRAATIVFNLQVLLGFGLAPLLIGVVRSHAGWSGVFATGMALFVLSSLLLAGMRVPPSEQRVQGVFDDLKEGFASVAAQPLLRQLLLAAIVAYAMTGPLQVLLPKLAREVLGLSEVQRGAYLGLMALALIVGGVGALFLGRWVPHGRVILGGTLAGGLLFASLSVWQGAVLSSMALGGVGVLGGMVISLVVSGIQAQAPDATRGRVMAIYSIISQVVPAGSGVLAGVLVRQLGVQQAILVSGLGLGVLAVFSAVAMPRLRHMVR